MKEIEIIQSSKGYPSGHQRQGWKPILRQYDQRRSRKIFVSYRKSGCSFTMNKGKVMLEIIMSQTLKIMVSLEGLMVFGKMSLIPRLKIKA